MILINFNPLPLFQNYHVTENTYNATNSAIWLLFLFLVM
nr:MAG TPA: hypothetical protein [Caudoviricetes sp.]